MMAEVVAARLMYSHPCLSGGTVIGGATQLGIVKEHDEPGSDYEVKFSIECPKLHMWFHRWFEDEVDSYTQEHRVLATWNSRNWILLVCHAPTLDSSARIGAGKMRYVWSMLCTWSTVTLEQIVSQEFWDGHTS